MCSLPPPVRGRGEHFGIRTSRKKKTVKGRRMEGWQGTCLRGEAAF